MMSGSAANYLEIHKTYTFNKITSQKIGLYIDMEYNTWYKVFIK